MDNLPARHVFMVNFILRQFLKCLKQLRREKNWRVFAFLGVRPKPKKGKCEGNALKLSLTLVFYSNVIKQHLKLQIKKYIYSFTGKKVVSALNVFNWLFCAFFDWLTKLMIELRLYTKDYGFFKRLFYIAIEVLFIEYNCTNLLISVYCTCFFKK